MRGAVLAVLALGGAISFVGCDSAPQPARPSPPSAAGVADRPLMVGSSQAGAAVSVSWQCIDLSATWRPADCPKPASTIPLRLSAAALPTSPPGSPSSLVAQVQGSQVTLSWRGPTAGGCETSLIVEAGSAPGAADIANFEFDNQGLCLSDYVAERNFLNVPARTYFVRLRSKNPVGVSAPSNEVVVTVGGGSSCPPLAPVGLSAGVSGSSVTLFWSPPAGTCVPTSYIVEAGSASGLANLANFSTGNAATSYAAAGVAAGTYFVRTRAGNGSGTSAPSNEIVVVVGTAPPCSYVLNPTSQSVSTTGGSFAASIATSCAWSAASDQPWLTITSGSSGSGNGAIAYSVAANATGAARTARITVSGPGPTAQLTVTQAATTCSYSLQTTNRTVPSNASSYSVDLMASCAWTASSDQSFLTITSGSSGTTNGTIIYSVTANGVTPRTAHITVTGAGGTAQLTLNQEAAPPPLNAGISVTGTPCVAPSSGSVTCSFNASASGGQPPYAYSWTFQNSGNAQVITASGQQVSPSLGCGYSSGTTTFTVNVTLQVTSTGGGTPATATLSQPVARAAGACGT